MVGAAARKRLKRLYDQLPQIDCQRKCQECCGPITMTPLEFNILQEQMPDLAVLTDVRGLCQLKEKPDIPSGYADQPVIFDLEMNACPFLDEESGDCTGHENRPMLCRLWGVVENLRCPFGCLPSPGYLTTEEGYRFLHEVERLSRMYGPVQLRGPWRGTGW